MRKIGHLPSDQLGRQPCVVARYGNAFFSFLFGLAARLREAYSVRRVRLLTSFTSFGCGFAEPGSLSESMGAAEYSSSAKIVIVCVNAD